MPKAQRVTYDISWETLLKVVALGAGAYLTFLLRDIIFLLFVVFIFVAAVNPTIVIFQKYMSRSIAVILFFTLLTLIILGLGYLLLPLVVTQVNQLLGAYPLLIEKAKPYLTEGEAARYTSLFNQLSDSATSVATSFSKSALESSISIFGGLLTFVTGIVISFYLLLEEKNARTFFAQVLPRHRFQAVYVTVQKISDKMGQWIRGQSIVMVLVAVMNFITFLALGVPTPLPLALWAGVMEAIPYIGPTLGFLPALLLLLVHGNFVGALILLIASYGLIQQVESHILVPSLMGKAIGLSPVLVILSLIIGAQLFGIVGALIALPAAAIVSVVVEEWPNLRKIWADDPEEVTDDPGR